jgi:ribosomal 30S subunit maturation factor RimM
MVLQLCLLLQLQLFGDEAFYWLEGQHLSWSYSELPGWTAWMTRLGTELFGQHYFAVRIVSYMAYLSIFVVIFLFNKKYQQERNSIHWHILLFFALPIMGLIAVMALPDVWMLVFVSWLSYLLFYAVEKQNDSRIVWVVIGVLLACAINVHVRMWIWLFFSGLAFIVVFWSNARVLRPALFVSMPIAMLGFIPILVFNFQHDFSLFAFQFGRRHPWQFQLQNISFILAQLIVISPLVFVFWFRNVIKIKSYLANNRVIAWLLLSALSHWLFYAIMVLFADGLRTTVHWLLISYLPVIVISGLITVKINQVFKWTAYTGVLMTLLLLLVLLFKQSGESNVQARILDNSLGWKVLAENVREMQQQYQVDALLADYFMTAAELSFELKNANKVMVLPHKKNVKHGRQAQLRIMDMLLTNTRSFKDTALLIVEDSTLKLQEKGQYYHKLCTQFRQMELLRSVDVGNSNKLFHIFIINRALENNQKICQVPPLFYVETEEQDEQISIHGWVVLDKVGIKSVSIKYADKAIKVESHSLENTGIALQFPEINDPNQPFNGFEISIERSQFNANAFQIQVLGNNDKQYLSQKYFLN